MLICFLSVSFFFSSRRRHTRYWRDWSSDGALPICRPSLVAKPMATDLCRSKSCFSPNLSLGSAQIRGHWFGDQRRTTRDRASACFILTARFGRSEERRVGKECRSRWTTYHEKQGQA